MHPSVNPSASTTSQILQITPATHPKWKFNHSVFQRENSRFWWRRPYWTCCPQISMAETTLNFLSCHNSNLLYFYHCKTFYMINSPVPALHISHVCQGSIRTKYHNYNYLLLRYLLVFFIIPKTWGCWISASVFHIFLCNISLRKSQKIFLE